MPVSELQKVKVEAIADKTTAGFTLDANGFCNWTLSLEHYCQKEVKLTYKISSAPLREFNLVIGYWLLVIACLLVFVEKFYS